MKRRKNSIQVFWLGRPLRCLHEKPQKRGVRTKGKRLFEMQRRSSFWSLGFWGFDFPNSVFAILFFGFILNAHQRRRQDAEKSRNRYIQRSRVKHLPHNMRVTCIALLARFVRNEETKHKPWQQQCQVNAVVRQSIIPLLSIFLPNWLETSNIPISWFLSCIVSLRYLLFFFSLLVINSSAPSSEKRVGDHVPQVISNHSFF